MVHTVENGPRPMGWRQSILLGKRMLCFSFLDFQRQVAEKQIAWYNDFIVRILRGGTDILPEGRRIGGDIFLFPERKGRRA